MTARPQLASPRATDALPAIAPERLPYHPSVQERFGIDRASWRALVEAVFPTARSVEGVILALSYCKARRLDPMKKPVHVVPIWDRERKRYVDTVWPGIGELRTTAMRTGLYAGCDAAQFGPDITQTFRGKAGEDGRAQDVTVTFPEWAQVTVYRMVGGQRVPVPGPRVYWLETYATQGRDGLPNEMWRRRPRGQLEKCFSPDTEVLTDQGFQRFDRVSGRIMQVTPAGIEPTTAKPFRQDYAGPMVVCDGDALNFCVTPDHDMITSAGKMEAHELFARAKSNGDLRIPLCVETDRSGWGGDPRVATVVGAIVADGWRRSDGRWTVAVSRERKIERLRTLDMHASTHVIACAGQEARLGDRTIMTRSDRTAFIYDLPLGILTARKTFELDFLLALNAEEAGILLDTLIEFDGHVTANGTRRLYSSDPERIGQMEILAVTAGYAVSPRYVRQAAGAGPNWYFTISRKRHTPVLSVSGALTARPGHRSIVRMQPENPSGEVWCCTVPSGVIVVRRGGLSMLCGNCAEAAALRRAFPEEIGNELAADEIGGASPDEAGIVATTATEEPSGEPEPQRADEPAEAPRRRARRIAQPEPAPDGGNEPPAAGAPPAGIPGEEAAKEELF